MPETQKTCQNKQAVPGNPVRLAFCDLASDWNPADNYFTHCLQNHGIAYTLCAGPEDKPDFVICGTFGDAFLSYDCCRISFSGEASYPDLNLYDYAMGFPIMECEGRYLRLPLYAMRDTWAPALQKHTRPFAEFAARETFCSFVVSNDFSAERNAFFAALNAHRPVASGGSYANNVGGPVADKQAFQRQTRFCIAYENSSTPGYVTEKLVDAFAAGCIPLYWGDPLVAGEFNPAAFLRADDYPSTAAFIAAIDALDADEAACRAMLAAPIITPGCRAAQYVDDSAAAAFLQSIFAKGAQGAICRNRGCWGQNYENDLKYYHKLARQAAQPKRLLDRLLGR